MIFAGVTSVRGGNVGQRKFDDISDFIDGVEMREEIVVENFNALLSVMVNNGGDRFERIENTSNDDEIGVKIF